MRQPRLKLLSAGVIQNDEVQESVTTQQPGSADGYKTVSSKKSENTQKMWFLLTPYDWGQPSSAFHT
jgi:hypothetical protein